MSAKQPIKLRCDTLFNFAYFCLYFNGAHPKMKKDIKWVPRFIVGMGLNAFFSYLYLNSCIKSLQKGDIKEACREATLVLVGFNTAFKYSVLVIHQKDTLFLFNSMDRDYALSERFPPEEQAVVREYAEHGRWVNIVWLANTMLTSSLFPLLAFYTMVSTYIRGDFKYAMLFECYVPFFEDIKYENRVFIPLFLLATTTGYLYSVMLVGFDPLAPIFMLHSCGQLELVKMQIRKLFAREDEEPSVRRDRVARIVRHLQDIYRCQKIVRENFTMIYEEIAKTTMVLLPITMHQIIESVRTGTPVLNFVSFFFGCTVHYYIPCHYSDRLMHQSLEIVQECYACGWENYWDSNARKDIILLMVRASKPLTLQTAFSTINLDSFSDMCRQSYSLFNLINAAMD